VCQTVLSRFAPLKKSLEKVIAVFFAPRADIVPSSLSGLAADREAWCPLAFGRHSSGASAVQLDTTFSSVAALTRSLLE